MPGEARDLIVKVFVSHHARERARERFPGFKAARIVDEVRAAMRAGRFSKDPPAGAYSARTEYNLYVWNDERCYPLVLADNGFVVVTTVARHDEGPPV